MKKRNIIKIISTALLIGCTVSVFSACNSEPKPETSKNSESSVSSKISTVSENSPDESTAESSVVSDVSEDNTSIPEISDPTPESSGEMIDGLFIYNNAAFELFYGDEDMAKNYADTISNIKKALGDDIKVYNVLVPTHVGIGLPDKFNDLCSSQKDYLNTICSSYSADIIGVNAFNTLMHHRNEYLYFNTDHHWTALAAYYAYADFAKAAGIDAIPLADMKKNQIKDYEGHYIYDTGLDTLADDYVTYYTVDYDIEAIQYDANGENPTESLLLHEYAVGTNAYGVFLGGDNPLMVVKNKQGNGQKIAIVKESYGNAFAPFIAYTYNETHIIDFRDFIKCDLKQYLKDNDIDQVIFINNSMASATGVRCDELAALVKS
ncbi:MAG: DHHW family protein [Clostridia bacterium]|nr:DHHW family protein [Clostridia bacterium]